MKKFISVSLTIFCSLFIINISSALSQELKLNSINPNKESGMEISKRKSYGYWEVLYSR